MKNIASVRTSMADGTPSTQRRRRARSGRRCALAAVVLAVIGVWSAHPATQSLSAPGQPYRLLDGDPAPELVVFVSPETVTLRPGETQPFSAGSNASVSLQVSWSATGGSISANGLYTAGSTPGTFHVLAMQSGMAATAAVTIASPDPVEIDRAISPGENIQTIVSNSPAGTKFLIKAGVHRRQSVRPKDAMVFIGEPGAVLDGEGVTGQAFVAGSSANVTVRGLRITRYAPPNATAAVEGHGSRGWVVEDNEIDHHANGTARVYGLRVGSGWIVRRNRVHHNAWVGIAGFQATDVLIEENEIFANPPAQIKDTVGEAANIKLYGCGQVVIRRNIVRDGPHRGIWTDRSAPDILVEDNRVLDHGSAGIWHEVGYRAVIRGNVVERAGLLSYYSSGWIRGGGIQITNSPDVHVTGNTVADSLNGIIALEASGYYDGPHGPSILKNLLVERNTIRMPAGQSGIRQNVGDSSVYTSRNNRYAGNTYHLGSQTTPFTWNDRNLTVAQWQATGNDENGVFVR